MSRPPRRVPVLALLATLAAVAAFSLAPRSGLAGEDDDVTVFETVDSHRQWAGTYHELTGVVRGEAEPQTMGFHMDRESLQSTCSRYILVMMERPGRYLLSIEYGSSSIQNCTLEVR